MERRTTGGEGGLRLAAPTHRQRPLADGLRNRRHSRRAHLGDPPLRVREGAEPWRRPDDPAARSISLSSSSATVGRCSSSATSSSRIVATSASSFAGRTERITSSILADRLDRLVDAGILTRSDDPTHKQKAVYRLTDSGVDLVPILATIGHWGAVHCPANPDLAAATQELEYDLPQSWAALMESLRASHAT